MRPGRLGTGEELNSDAVPTRPRPAAATILLRDGEHGLEVLLVKRNPASRFAPAAWVFPGGAVREGDADRRATALRELQEEAGVALDGVDRLLPFSRWITPAAVRIRFDSVFFVGPAPPENEPRCDGQECVDARWMRPADALAAYERSELELVYPTIKHLEQLALWSSLGEALEAARERDLAPVEPRVVVDDAGARVLMPDEV
jgi:8-oxo-dGTP pyrophosphatase MutT (NUDIX family)